ncbi:phosphotransferase [Streptomyces sp. Z26]|uniref:phosphotransferase n=1 Tax=Streptomyces sp. Z26 TaxID=2500177 RepID=UPI0026D4F0A5
MISGDGTSRNGATDLTEERADAVFREACETAGLDPSGAELLRLGSNAVYRLASPPVIVRIARDPEALEEMRRAVGVARWLESEDFPATRVMPDVEQPAFVGGRVVTYWRSAQDEIEYGRLDELADLLKRLHWLEEPEVLGLPYFDPFAKGGIRSVVWTASGRRTGSSWRSAPGGSTRSTTGWTSCCPSG